MDVSPGIKIFYGHTKNWKLNHPFLNFLKPYLILFLSVESTYTNQSSEENYEGNCFKNSFGDEEYISACVGDNDIFEPSLLTFNDWSLP